MIEMISDVLRVSVMSVLFIGLLLGINKTFGKKYSLKWIQFIWFMLAVRLIIPADLIHITLPQQAVAWKQVITRSEVSSQRAAVSQQGNEKKANDTSTSGSLQSATSSEEKVTTITPGSVVNIIYVIHYGLISISIIWLIGVFLQLLRYSLSYIVFMRRLNRNNKQVTVSHYLQLLEKTNQKNLNIRLYTNIQVKSPFSTGLARKKIILPDKSYTDIELEAILCHEYNHLKNRDIWFKMLLCLVKSVHWFNPMVYRMEHEISQNMEIICDEAVIENRKLEYRQMYGRTIMDTIRDLTAQPESCIVSHFEGEEKQMKDRIRNIIKPLGRRKKPVLITAICAVCLLASVITFEAVNHDKPKAASAVKITEGVKKAAKKVKEEKKVTILVAGAENINDDGDKGRSDSILLINWNPQTRELSARSLCRDMYVEIPGNESNKLNAAFHIGGMDLLKQTVTKNFGVPIDYGITINFDGFEKIIDLLGGVKMNITKDEASYLNTTNYISKKKNRTIKQGENLLNGNQALGYARVRYRSTATGKTNDFGRTERLQNLLRAMLDKTKSLKLRDYAGLIKEGYASVDSEIPLLQTLSYLESLFKTEYKVSCKTIPVEDSYEGQRKDGKAVLIWDKDKNIKELQDIK